MAEPQRISALSGHLDALSGAGREGGPAISELRPGAIAQIMGAPPPARLMECMAGYALREEPAPGRCVHGEQVRVLWSGPDQYLVVSQQHSQRMLAQSLVTALGGQGAVVDLSHARTVLHLQGPRVQDVLAKGCPADLEGMANHQSASTVLSHFNMLLHRDGEQAFEIYVFRSFGLACFQWLWAAGREYGIRLDAGAGSGGD